MVSSGSDLLVVVGGLVIVIVLGAGFRWLFVTSARRTNPLPAEGACVACGSTDLDVLAPGVYRCRACGYEGGANRAALETAQARSAWGRRPWPERVAAASEDVLDAERRLDAIESDVDRAIRHANPTSVAAIGRELAESYGHDSEGDFDNLLSNLVTTIHEAISHLSAASTKVPGIPVPVVESPEWGRIRSDDLAKLYRAARSAAAQARASLDVLASSADGAAKVDPA